MTKDVTAEAFIESGNTEVAEADKQGLMTTVRRGEAPMLARFEGAYAATTITVMGDRTGFAWKEPPKFNKIDELVSAKWQRMKIQPSGCAATRTSSAASTSTSPACRPSAEDVRAFLADSRDTRIKRDALVDKLIGSPAFVDHWTNKWADMLQVNSKFLGEEGAKLFRDWIRAAGREQHALRPVRLLASSPRAARTRTIPPRAISRSLRTPEETMENTTHLFLATRFNCNKCHDHPFERWNQDQYYQTAAFFAQVGLAGGSRKPPARPSAAPPSKAPSRCIEIVNDTGKGEVIHLRTNKAAPPKFPFPAKFEDKRRSSRREKLAAWMTSPDNQYFAMSYANRIWGYLIGTGVIEPLDDIRAGNPPSNPELLQLPHARSSSTAGSTCAT